MADCPYCTRAMSSLEFCTPIPGQQVAHAACRLSYLAGVRAGLRAAGEVCEERGQQEWDRMMAAKAASRDWEFATANVRCHVATQLASAIAALDAEEVAGREP